MMTKIVTEKIKNNSRRCRTDAGSGETLTIKFAKLDTIDTLLILSLYFLKLN